MNHARPAPNRIASLLQQGVARHRAGQLADAARLYQAVLAQDPRQSDALHLLGVILCAGGQFAAGLTLMAQALTLAPRSTEILSNLGNALKAAGRVDEAIENYRRALALDPRSAALHLNLGTALQAKGQLAAAAESYQRALELDPSLADAHSNLGSALCSLGRWSDAAASCRRALALRPAYVEALTNLGAVLLAQGKPGEAEQHLEEAHRLQPDLATVLASLGQARQSQGRVEAAIEAYRRALEIQPSDAGTLSNLGTALQELERFEDAADCFGQAARLDPARPEYHTNLGAALHKLRRFVGAEAAHRAALALAPDGVEALTHLGAALLSQGREDEAIALQRRALALNPNHADARWNLSTPVLGRGQIREGWELYEARWDTILRSARRPFPQPWWDGRPLPDGRMLIWREQGVGDEIMFASCLPDLQDRMGHVILACTPKLRPLLARSFPWLEVWEDWELADPRELDIDCHCPIGSLPRFTRPTLESFPRHEGYLVVDPADVAHWREQIEQLGPGLKVGISWRSKLMTEDRQGFYSRLEEWGPILSPPGVHFVNLQYDRCDQELAAAEAAFGSKIHRLPALDLFDDLDGVAALMMSLDLVIAPDNSVGELAAALGRRVWRLDGGGDWSTLGTDHRPWQPSMTLFRRSGGDWATAIQSVGEALRMLVS